MTVDNVYTETKFWSVFTTDLVNAKCRVLLHSAFLSQHRIRELEPWFKYLAEKRVTVCVFVQQPRCMLKKLNMRTEKDGDDIQQFKYCVDLLLNVGVHVTSRPKEHEKLAVIDDTILWEGSLNLLSHIDTKERMRRLIDREESMEAIKLHNMDKCTRCIENIAKCGITEAASGLSKSLAQIRKKAGVSQAGLAKRAGLNQSHVCRFETGAKGVSVEVLLAISQALEVTLVPVPASLIPSVAQLLQQHRGDDSIPR